jgi:hypothetical protein
MEGDKQLRKIYRAGSGEKPGKYYFLDERKLVPGQSIRKDGKTIDNPDFEKDYLHLYSIVDKPGKRTPVRGKDRDNYKILREQEPGFAKKINMEDINMVAIQCGWKLSTKAIKGFQAWGKGAEEITQILNNFKTTHSDCNYIDYDHLSNQFLAKWKHFPDKN